MATELGCAWEGGRGGGRGETRGGEAYKNDFSSNHSCPQINPKCYNNSNDNIHKKEDDELQ